MYTPSNQFVHEVGGRSVSKKRSPASPDLAQRVLACASFGTAWEGQIYRATSLKYASSKDLVTGMGAMKFGGRWNPPGEFATVYGAVDPETAFAESLANQRYYGLPVHLVLPMVVAAIDARLVRVLDICEKRVSMALEVDADALVAIDWRKEMDAAKVPQTHLLARELHRAGWEAVLVPSGARRGTFTMVVFPENLGSKSRIARMGTDFVRPS